MSTRLPNGSSREQQRGRYARQRVPAERHARTQSDRELDKCVVHMAASTSRPSGLGRVLPRAPSRRDGGFREGAVVTRRISSYRSTFSTIPSRIHSALSLASRIAAVSRPTVVDGFPKAFCSSSRRRNCALPRRSAISTRVTISLQSGVFAPSGSYSGRRDAD